MIKRKAPVMYIFKPHLRPYSIIVISYMAVFLGIALKIQNSEFLFYQVTMMIIIGFVVYMDKRVTFSALVLGGLAFWGFVHLAGGLIPIPQSWTVIESSAPVLYDLKLSQYTPKYDQLVHAFGFGLSVIAAHEALQAHLKKTLPLSLPICVTLFFIALGLGALNEMIEFVAVISIPNTNVGGYLNTGWDLVSNAVGALIGVLYLKLRRRNLSKIL